MLQILQRLDNVRTNKLHKGIRYTIETSHICYMEGNCAKFN